MPHAARIPDTARRRPPLGPAWALLARWCRLAQRRRALRRLLDNPHLLKDIGLSPHDAAAECAKRFWET